MVSRATLLILPVVMVLAARLAFALETDPTEKALSEITDTADRICNVVKIEGSSETIKVQGDVKAELDGLLKKLAGIGFDANGLIDTSKWSGPAQADLATALNNSSICKERIFNRLLDRLLPDKPGKKGARAEGPLYVTLLDGATAPLDGYRFVNPPVLPPGREPGLVLPGGGRSRLMLQAVDPDNPTEVDRIAIDVSLLGKPDGGSWKYTIDPTQQSGFGAARPRRFNVKVGGDHGATIYYLDAAGHPHKVGPENILAGTPIALLRFDKSSAGLQETIDLNFAVSTPGLYEIRLMVRATSMGKTDEIATQPIYLVRD